MISFPVADNQPTASISTNLTQVQQLGNSWNSATLKAFASSLSAPPSNANAGSLTGNRMFYANDYMVHRGSSYVTTLRMFSTRTLSTECRNSQNPYGFHLSDGAAYTYLRGNEYEDIAAAWDWNLIPGITTDYGNTPLSCTTTGISNYGLEKYVGGVSNGTVGIAAMRYTNPLSKSLHFQKTWFFLDNDVQFVMLNNISSGSSAPVRTVLDQKRHNGPVYINGTDQSAILTDANGSAVAFARGQTLWHSGVGYALDGTMSSTTLNVRTANQTGQWSMIGISTQPPTTVDLFAAYLQHNTLGAISYSVFPGTTSYQAFATKRSQRNLQTASNTNLITALFDANYNKAYAVFWGQSGGSVSFSPGFSIASTTEVAVMYNRATGYLTVSDPSQTISSVTITVSAGKTSKSVSFTVPQGGLAGSSLTKRLPCCIYP